jgi:hypothetical protein
MKRDLLLVSIVCMSASFAGCAATILNSAPDQPSLIQGGATEADMTMRFGSPTMSARLDSPTQALSLWEKDRQVSVLSANGLAVSNSVFAFKGRLDSKARAGQAGFDSFMTLGLAEIYLIPKAIWERATDEDLQLTVWFDAAGQALAFKWEPRKTN